MLARYSEAGRMIRKHETGVVGNNESGPLVLRERALYELFLSISQALR